MLWAKDERGLARECEVVKLGDLMTERLMILNDDQSVIKD